MPFPPLLIPGRAHTFVIELHESADLVLVGDFLEVSLDFLARRIELAPLGIGLVDEGVTVCGHIAGYSRIPILVPCSPDFRILLVNDEL